MDDDNITKIGIKFKNPTDEEMMLKVVRSYTGCRDHAYIIDPELDTVSCGICEKTFNPMSVLEDLARRESKWTYNGERYREEMKRLGERSRTKCKHCGKMTRISNN